MQLSENLKSLLGPVQMVNRLLWLSLTFSIVAYVAVAWWLAQSPEAPREAVPQAATLVLTVLAAGTGIASRFVPRFLLSDERLAQHMAEAPDLDRLATNAQTGKLDSERLRKIESLSPPERKLLGLAGPHFTAFIIQLVMSESVAIFGLVLSILSLRLEPLLPFAAAALVLMFLSRPNLEALMERALRLNRSF